jgi:quercetin dioxygenase-like cupin family protein
MYSKRRMILANCSGAFLVLLILGGPSGRVCDQADGKGAASAAVATTGQWRVTMPDKIEWRAAALLPPGAQVAVLEGDPAKPGFFTMRLKMPDGYRIPAHSHSRPERVTVLSGTLYLGLGDGSDAASAKRLGAGSYTSMPPKMVHFGWMKGETILQLSSIGPWTVTYVNPNDDPRTARK